MEKTVERVGRRGSFMASLLFVILGMIDTAIPMWGQESAPKRATGSKADPRISVVQGKAQLREAGTKKLHLLTTKDRDIALLPGDEVICEKGRLILVIHNHRVIRTAKQDWYPIPISPTDARLTADLKTFFDVAGRARGPVYIYSPPYDDGTVWPEKLVFRWESSTQKRWGDAVLTANGKQIWSAEKVDIRRGMLESVEARKALCAVREQDAEAEVKLHLHIPESSEGPDMVYSATFAMLSKESIHALQEELRKSDLAETTMMRYMLRANAFSRRRLYSEAAGEYEKALEICPNRYDIRFAAYNALLRTGNMAAAGKIKP